MLKIRDNVDLKELEKYGFEEHYTTYTRDYNNGYLTMVDKETGEILKVDYEWSFLKNKYYNRDQNGRPHRQLPDYSLYSPLA